MPTNRRRRTRGRHGVVTVDSLPFSAWFTFVTGIWEPPLWVTATVDGVEQQYLWEDSAGAGWRTWRECFTVYGQVRAELIAEYRADNPDDGPDWLPGMEGKYQEWRRSGTTPPPPDMGPWGVRFAYDNEEG